MWKRMCVRVRACINCVHLNVDCALLRVNKYCKIHNSVSIVTEFTFMNTGISAGTLTTSRLYTVLMTSHSHKLPQHRTFMRHLVSRKPEVRFYWCCLLFHSCMLGSNVACENGVVYHMPLFALSRHVSGSWKWISAIFVFWPVSQPCSSSEY